MEPMWRTGSNLESRREFDAFYTWGQRGGLWVIATGGGFAITALVLWGPGPLPESVNFPVWLGASLVTFITVPGLSMLGVAFVHLVKANRARRREARDGQVVYRNRVARWIDMNGLAIGLAISGFAVAVSIWWTLHQSH
jgi:hypothetical protein